MQESQFFLSNKNNLLERQDSEGGPSMLSSVHNHNRNDRLDSFVSAFDDENVS